MRRIFFLAATLLALTVPGSGEIGEVSFSGLPEKHKHPSVLCIGVARSGVSDLYSTFLELFRSDFNRPTKKELNMLARQDFFTNQTAFDEYHKALNVTGPRPKTLDFSPHYFWSQVAPKNAVKLLPDGTKTIVMLRDPVSMILSLLNYRKGRNGKSPVDGQLVPELDATELLLVELHLLQRPYFFARLHEAIHSEPAKGLKAFKQLSREIDIRLAKVFGPSFGNKGQAYILPGLFLPPLRAWVDMFFKKGAKQTLILFSDAYFSDRRKALAEAVIPFVFGEGYEVKEEVLQRVSSQPQANKMDYTKNVEPTLRCALNQFFQPYNCLLAELLRKASSLITAYPAERLQSKCDLFGNVTLTDSCGLDAYTEKVRARLAVSRPPSGWI